MNNIKYDSPKIKALTEQIRTGDSNSINLFWQDIERFGAPLIEEIEGDSENVLITFLYKYDLSIDNVIIYGSFPGFRYQENIMDRIMDTNMMDAIDNMYNVLLSKGYEVKYEHFQSGHDYLSWGETLANSLTSLIGTNSLKPNN